MMPEPFQFYRVSFDTYRYDNDTVFLTFAMTFINDGEGIYKMHGSGDAACSDFVACMVDALKNKVRTELAIEWSGGIQRAYGSALNLKALKLQKIAEERKKEVAVEAIMNEPRWWRFWR